MPPLCYVWTLLLYVHMPHFTLSHTIDPCCLATDLLTYATSNVPTAVDSTATLQSSQPTVFGQHYFCLLAFMPDLLTYLCICSAVAVPCISTPQPANWFPLHYSGTAICGYNSGHYSTTQLYSSTVLCGHNSGHYTTALHNSTAVLLCVDIIVDTTLQHYTTLQQYCYVWT